MSQLNKKRDGEEVKRMRKRERERMGRKLHRKKRKSK
jgi:hypothetical protein